MRAYFDESGHAEDPECFFMGMAGFVAPRRAWEILEAEWLRTLQDHGLSEPFHMREFAHSIGQFDGWKEDRRQALLGALLECIARTEAAIVGSLIYLPDYDSLTVEQRRRLAEPYYIAFHQCTVGAQIVASEAGEEPVDIVYSWNEDLGTNDGGWAARLWQFMKVHPSNKQLGSYASLKPFDSPALQAADLFAYELCHDYENQVRRGSDRMRYPLRRILEMQTDAIPLINVFDRERLLQRLGEGSTDTREATDRALFATLDWTTGRGDWKDLPDKAIEVFRARLRMPALSEGHAAQKTWRDTLLTAPSQDRDYLLRLAAIYSHDGYVKEARLCYRLFISEAQARET